MMGRLRLLAGVFRDDGGRVDRFHVVFWGLSRDEWLCVRRELEALIREIDLYLRGGG